MTMCKAKVLIAACLAGGIALAAAPVAFAQTAPADGPGGGMTLPNAFQGFSRGRNEPVRIEASSLEVHDRERYAVFSGNVVVQQGDSTMRSRELRVYYEASVRPPGKGDGAPSAKGGKSNSAAGAVTQQRIRRLEAIGGVIITSKDQKATGDFGVFDMPTNTATITGNVVISQGPNVMRADKLVVDLKTGWSRMEGGKDGRSRVQGLFVPNAPPGGEPKRAAEPK